MSRMKMRFMEIANKITGLETPVFGISWNPPVLEVDIAKRMVTFLEDRRVLYASFDSEDMTFSTESILKIRERLTEDLEQLDRSSELGRSIADMRAACRKFLDKVQGIDPRDVAYPRRWRWDKDAIAFFSALGELRAIFGYHIAQIAVKYGIDVEEQLTTIFPASPFEDEQQSSFTKG